MEQLTTAQFIEKAQSIHGQQFDYSCTVYVSARQKLLIGCSAHGVFSKRPRGHLQGQGCPKCGTKARDLKNTVGHTAFLQRAKSCHGDLYDYSKAVYENSEVNVIIICQKHGEFLQTPHQHVRGQGCPTCGKSKGNEGRESQGTWSARRWAVTQKGRVATLYCLKFSNENESFYKIGITFNLKQRLQDFNAKGYDVTVLELFQTMDAIAIFDAETSAKRRFKAFRHIPLLSFSGQQECFSLVADIRAYVAALGYNGPATALETAAAGKANTITDQGEWVIAA